MIARFRVESDVLEPIYEYHQWLTECVVAAVYVHVGSFGFPGACLCQERHAKDPVRIGQNQPDIIWRSTMLASGSRDVGQFRQAASGGYR